MELADNKRCTSIQPPIAGGSRCAGAAGHTGHHMSNTLRDWDEWGHDDIRDCGDCGVKPGQMHDAGCDLERCSYCGGQWIACGHDRTKKHDPRFARWTGLYPGSAEARTLGIDLNEFHGRGVYRVFFVKPT